MHVVSWLSKKALNMARSRGIALCPSDVGSDFRNDIDGQIAQRLGRHMMTNWIAASTMSFEGLHTWRYPVMTWAFPT